MTSDLMQLQLYILYTILPILPHTFSTKRDFLLFYGAYGNCLIHRIGKKAKKSHQTSGLLNLTFPSY
ncbi:unnamed protein product [Rhizophagus irregularis]|uniref:Uncharacterized protein n=1 Tax=Rhizophagus irregularis TaxID=588596 RepID=A0A916EM97_9GLOM|nr:unnamed protein product [Rhizophagus irregularis]